MSMIFLSLHSYETPFVLDPRQKTDTYVLLGKYVGRLGQPTQATEPPRSDARVDIGMFHFMFFYRD